MALVMRLAVLVLLYYCSSCVYGEEVKTIPEGISASIGHGIEYIQDPDESLTIEEVMRLPDGWSKTADEVFNKGYNTSAWWLKIQLHNPHPYTEWFLEVAYAVLDYLDLYIVKEGEIQESYRMGDKLKFRQRPIEHRYFVVPLSIPQSEQVTVYLKVKSSSSVQVPITLWERNNFNAADIGRTAIHGIYYGGLVIIAIYNLLIYLALGERTYLYYVGYVLAMFLFMASLNGWAFQFLWPLATQWNDTAILVSLTFVVLFGVLFTRRFLDFKKLAHSLVLSANLFVVLSVATIVACFVIPYSVGIRLVIVLAVAACIYALGAGLFAWYKKHPSARLFNISI